MRVLPVQQAFDLVCTGGECRFVWFWRRRLGGSLPSGVLGLVL